MDTTQNTLAETRSAAGAPPRVARMRWHGPLMALAATMAVTGVISVAGLLLDDRELVGAPIWAKPFKFSVSILIYAVTWAWLIGQLRRFRRTAWWAGTVISVSLFIEMAIVFTQTVRGERSHFNQQTPTDELLWSIMGATIAVLWLATLVAAVLLWFSPDMSDAVPKKLIRRYQREVGAAMGAYILVMLVWKRLLDMVDATWLRVVIALFPALLVCLVLRAFVRYVRDSDEMQRRIELESGAIAGLLVSAVYLAAGFLQSAELIAIPSKVAMIWVFPMLCMFYGACKIFVSRHYV